jgi:RHS repeat-associated protein
MPNPSVLPPDAELSFAYDASDMRVRKTVGAKHTLYVFGSLELRSTAHNGVDYAVTQSTEVPYLFANGVRLARVVQGTSTRVFLELGDQLGSTRVVLDRASGELVQRDTAYAYGAAESSYRTGEFEEFREDYRFTGKEDDVEVGLIYFGMRYYAPMLGRWISADPLAVHSPGEADLNLYAYVSGRALVAVDPVGLDDDGQDKAPDEVFPEFEDYIAASIAAENPIDTHVATAANAGRATPSKAPTSYSSKKFDPRRMKHGILWALDGIGIEVG